MKTFVMLAGCVIALSSQFAVHSRDADPVGASRPSWFGKRMQPSTPVRVPQASPRWSLMKMDQAPFPGWLSNSLLRQRNLAIRERLLLFKLLPQEVSFAFGIKSPEQLATAGVLCNLLTRTYGPKPIIDWAMREHKRRSVRAHSPEVMADLPVDPSFTPDEPDAAPTKYLPPHERVEEVTAVDIDFIPFSGEYNANMMLNALDHLVVFYMPWALKRKFSIHSAMDLLWPGTIKKISDYLCLDVMTRSASDQSYRREVNFQEEGE